MMERPEETSHNLYSLAERFCYDLCEELEYHKISRKYLTFEEYKVLREYYRVWNLETVKYFAHSEARLLRHIMKYIMGQPQNPRILDAGCGLGSQARHAKNSRRKIHETLHHLYHKQEGNFLVNECTLNQRCE